MSAHYHVKCWLIILLGGCLAGAAYSQSITIVDAESQGPVPFANIKVLEDKKIDVANVNGQFQLSDEHLNKTLILSCIGFYKDTFYCAALDDHRVELKPNQKELSEVVITGQYGANLQGETVHKVRTISSEELENMAAVNLQNALNYQLNVQISQDPVLGSQTQMQGIGGRNIKIMIDGVPVVGRMDGNIDLSQINMNDVERIEIVEGPMAVNYGTDALAGTINIIMKKEADSKLSGSASWYLESIGTNNLDFSLAKSFRGWKMRFAGGRNFFDGWSPNEDFSTTFDKKPADSGRAHLWNPREQYFASAMLSKNLKGWELMYQGQFLDELVLNRGLPSTIFGDEAYDDEFATQRSMNSFTVNKDFKKGYHLNIVSAYTHFNRVKNTYRTDLTTLDRNLAANTSLQDTSVFGLLMSRGSVVNKTALPSLSWQLGYEVSHDYGSGKRIEGNRQSLTDLAFFATTEWSPLEHLTLRPGLRYGYNSGYEVPLIGSLAALYQPHPHWTFRSSYGRGFRAPGVKELYFEFVDINHNILGNRNLRAEYSHNVQAGLGYERTIKGQQINFSADAFHNTFENRIELAASGQGTLFSYFNIGYFETMGVNLRARWSGDWWTLAPGFSHIRRLNPASVEHSELSRFNDFREFNLTGNITHPKSGTGLTLIMKHTGSRQVFVLSGEDYAQAGIASFTIMDALLSQKLFNESLVLTAGMRNLLDVGQVQAFGPSGGVHSSGSDSQLMAAGRTAVFKIQWNYGKK